MYVRICMYICTYMHTYIFIIPVHTVSCSEYHRLGEFHNCEILHITSF